MSTTTPTPKHLDEISAEWLSSVLASSVNQDIDLSSIRVRAITGSSGQDGEYGIISLEGDKPGSLPDEMFVKIMNLPPERRTPAFLGQTIRELTFFREFGHRVAARVPAFYYGHYDPETHDNVVLTESLAGWQIGETRAGIGVEGARPIARELGRLHGSTEGDPFFETDHQLLLMHEPEIAQLMSKGYGDAWPKHRDALSEVFTPAVVALCDSLIGEFQQAQEALSIDPAVLLHGDSRIDNVATRETADGAEAVLFDWGLAAAGNGIWDLVQMLGTGLLEGDHEHLRCLVETYVEARSQVSGRAVSADETWRMFRSALPVLIGIRVTTLRHTADLFSGDPIDEMRLTALVRLGKLAERLGLGRG